MIAQRKLFGNSVDKLLIGWFTLFLTNVLFPLGGCVADVLAIFSKIVIFFGILNYDFAIVTEKIHKELASPFLPFDTGFKPDGGLRLAAFRRGSPITLMTVSKWLKEKIDYNVNKNVETSILVLNDVIPYEVLRSAIWKKQGLVNIFIFTQNFNLHKEFTSLKYEITELGMTITEISKMYAKKEMMGEIILVDLSIMIHTFGVNKTYSFLLNKMGMLRTSGTTLTAVFHPNTHDEHIASLFKSIADSVEEV